MPSEKEGTRATCWDPLCFAVPHRLFCLHGLGSSSLCLFPPCPPVQDISMLTTAPFSRSHCGLALPEPCKCTKSRSIPAPVGSGFASPYSLSLQAGSLYRIRAGAFRKGSVECTYSCRSPMGCQCEVETGQPSTQGCLVSEPGPLRGRCTSAPRSS